MHVSSPGTKSYLWYPKTPRNDIRLKLYAGQLLVSLFKISGAEEKLSGGH